VNLTPESSKIENQHVTFARHLYVEAIRIAAAVGSLNDPEDVKTRDGPSVLGGLLLGIVEVGANGAAEVTLHRLHRLQKDHERNFFGGLDRLAKQAIWKTKWRTNALSSPRKFMRMY
jgi:hypothetical protein